MKKMYLSLILSFLTLWVSAQVVNTESFDGSTFVPTGWTYLTGSGAWSRYTSSSHPSGISPHSGAGMAGYNSYTASSGSNRAIITPAYSLVGRGSATPTVSFWIYRESGYSSSADRVEVYINTSAAVGGTLLGTVNRSPSLSPSVGSNGWYQYTYNVPAGYTGSDNYLVLKAISGWGNDVYIDDVSWESYPSATPCSGTPTPGTVVAGTSIGCTPYSSVLSLLGSTADPGMEYQWQSSSDNASWSDVSGATDNSYTVPSVTANIYYRCNLTCSNSGMSAATPGTLLSLASCYSMTFNTTVSSNICSGLLYDDGGPSGDYTPTTGNSVYTIYPGAAGTGSKVSLHFNMLTVETCCDYVQIFDGNSTAAPQIGGNYTSAPGDITSTASDGSLTILLHSDVSISYAGFESVISNTVVNPITANPAATTSTCVGYAPSLSVTANGSSNTYMWYDNGTVNSNTGGTATGVTTSAFDPPTSSAGMHYYYCVVTTACGDDFTTSTAQVTVNPSPDAITGTLNACSGATSALASTTGGGTWSTSSAIASVDAGGVVTAGGVAGTTTVSYTVAGCAATATFVVNASPGTTSGSLVVCEGATTTLSNTGGVGSWTSDDAGIASVAMSTGVVTGVAPGTTTISYANGCGTPVESVVTVNPQAGSITGSTISCVAGSNTLANSVAGGTWSSSDAGIATIDGTSGEVTGVAAGTCTITYDPNNTCAVVTRTQTINLSPSTPTVTPSSVAICAGNNSMLNANSVFTDVADVASGTISVGIPDANATGNSTTLDVSLPAGAVITGVSVNFDITHTWVSDLIINLTAPNGNTLNLVNSVGGSGDNFTNTTISSAGGASLGSSSAPFTGTYSPSASTGIGPTAYPSNVSSFSSLYSTPDGTWRLSMRDQYFGDIGTLHSWSLAISYSVQPTVSWAPNTGLYTDAGLSTAYAGSDLSSVYASPANSGTTPVVQTYTVTSTMNGCSAIANAVVTVNPLPAAVAGASEVCEASMTTFTNPDAGGTWSSTNTGVATIDAGSGVATGVAAGNTTVSYTFTATGCASTKVLTVNPLPAVITGTAQVCEAATTTLADADAGGTWTSTNTTIATVNSGTGEVSGLSAGTSAISYTLSTGCQRGAIVSVNPLPVLTVTPTSVTTLCLGDGTSAYSAAATMPGFSLLSQDFNGSLAGWTIDNPIPNGPSEWQQVATGFDGTAGDGSQMLQAAPFLTFSEVHTRLTSPSFSTVGYASATLTFNYYIVSDPSDNVAAVEYSVDGGTSWLAITDYKGGVSGSSTWSASTPDATLALPAGAIGQSDVKLRWNYDGITYGWFIDNIVVSAELPAATYTWSGGSDLSCTTCDNPTITPSAAGSNVYTVTAVSSAACTSAGTVTISVNPLPAVIGGSLGVCYGLTTTLTNADAGGTWSSGNTTVATIGSGSGLVNALSVGTAEMTYTLPTGCIRTAVVTVNPLPDAITGTMDVCKGLTTTLNDATSGGTWTSGNTAVATISSSGIVTGVAAGNTNVTYTITATGCIAAAEITVNPLPAAIAGTMAVCEGLTTTLTDADAGGTWSSGATATATVDGTTGVVTGVVAGNAMITYMLPTGCIASAEVTVNPLPAAITGTMEVCEGLTTTLADATSGGNWSSSDPSTASVDAAGIVTGVVAGNANVTYTLPLTGCIMTTEVTVNPLPAAITGNMEVCEGLTTTLADATSGGNWSSSDPSTAAVDAAGVVTGVVAGNANVTYTLPTTGCIMTTEVTVNPLPAAITGTMEVCEGLTTTLADLTTGGSWSSGNTAVATIDGTTGVVSGVAAGNVNMTYTLPLTGCLMSAEVTVNPLPAAITGTMDVCEGLTTTLASATASGNWSSSDATTAAVDATGVVTGVVAGNAMITYTLPVTGCIRTADVTVNPLPAAITGIMEVCKDATTTLADVTAAGSWSSGDVTVATVDGTGMVTGMMAGNAMVTYTLPTGCIASTEVTVDPLPVVHNVTGGGSYCAGGSGVTVGLDNSENGDTYALYTGGSVVASMPGTGAAVSFGSFTAAGTYTVMATTSLSCSDGMAGDANVVINPLVTPVVTTTLSTSDTVCDGTSVTYTANPVNGGTTPTYEWYVNGTLSGTGDTYTYAPADGDLIHVELTSNEACPSPATVSADTTMMVMSNETPTATIVVGPNDTVCQYSMVVFGAVSAFGGDSPVYTWYKNGAATGTTGSTYTYMPVAGDVVLCKLNSNYRCPIVNDVSSNSITMHVDSVYVPAVDIRTSTGLNIAPGQSVTFTAVVAQGGPAPTYQWVVNSAAITGQTSSTYTSSTIADNDSVTCIVYGTGDCSYYTFNSVRMKVSTGFFQPEGGMADVRLMPNPNNGSFRVTGKFPSADNSGVQIDVTDMLGQVVYRSQAITRNGELDERIQLDGNLANGMYILNVRSGEDSRQFHFVLKQ